MGRCGRCHRRHPCQFRASAQSQGLEPWNRKSSHCPSHIAQGVAAAIPVVRGIVGGADADAIENDDCRASHQAFGMVCTKRNRSAVSA